MKQDGTNFKHIRVCEQCGNTFETNINTACYCPSCVKKIVDSIIVNKNEIHPQEIRQIHEKGISTAEIMRAL